MNHVELINISRPPRMLVFNIPIGISVQAKLDVVEGRRVTLLHHDAGTGEHKRRRVTLRHGASIRILAKATLTVPEVVLEAPEVKEALGKTVRRGKTTVRPDPVEEKKPTTNPRSRR